jgi:hypothetical protein
VDGVLIHSHLIVRTEEVACSLRVKEKRNENVFIFNIVRARLGTGLCPRLDRNLKGWLKWEVA